MKKLTLAATATALAIATVLTGCGRNEDDAATTASTSSSPATTAPATTDSSSSSMASTTPSTDSSSMASSTTSTPSTDASMSSQPSTMASADTSATTSTTAMGAGGSGQTVYSSTCAMCHAAGVAGAPKPGDKADWQPRIAQGKDTLYQHAIAGYQGKKGMMPPKGGNTSIPDADVKAAVDFMVDQSK